MTAEPRAHSIPLLSLIPGLGQSAERDVVAEATYNQNETGEHKDMMFLRNFWKEEEGQDLIEYTLLMAHEGNSMTYATRMQDAAGRLFFRYIEQAK